MATNTFFKLGDAVAGVSFIVACVLFRPLLRRWYSRWGTRTEDIARQLPGDEIVRNPCGGYTTAISIKRPPPAVWPWLVQVGQNKGGFYSYELLENMVGCDIHNRDRIVKEYQGLKVGDHLIMHPSPKAPIIPVVTVELHRVIVYGGKIDENTGNNWIFFLEEKGMNTRLIVRWHFEYKPGLANRIIYNWFMEPIAAVMQRKMLLTIRDLVEKS